ncbi:LAME_0A03554g1_1 [Lachancea meyersii CBS 8951]|uniref:LAME_0A03554g1_1 n=1 Tax=Lachancea meyersii CBS 8951 TaxID=1266667 RepID=A0A1G4IND8_9SACH|nr:LAME_0A03554g1_1 [Lachancea meyersii CBS 8951]
MASPIFLSKPHPGYSPQALKTGLKIAADAFWVLASHFIDQCRANPKETLKLALISIVWRLALVPINSIAKPLFLFRYVAQALDTWLACYCVLRFASARFAQAFWTSFYRAAANGDELEEQTLQLQQRIAVKEAMKSPTESIPWYTVVLIIMGTLMADVESVSTTGIAEPQFGRAKFMVLTALWYTLLGSSLDAVTAIAASAAMAGCVSLSTNMTLILQFYHLECLTKFLLVPYLQQARFSPPEYAMWLRARGGVFCGFLMPLYVVLSSSRVPFVSPVFVYVLVYPVAYLMAEIAEPVPVNAPFGTRAHSAWCARQLLWLNVAQRHRSSEKKDNTWHRPIA